MPDFSHERQFNGPVIGIDEAGRGPWAGPVTATAIWLCPSSYNNLPADIDDSKKIKAARRASLASQLIAPPHFHHTVSIDVANIDRMGILQATFLAMTMAAAGLFDKFIIAGLTPPVHALVDGNLLPPNMPLPATALIKGDSRSLSIAAASIIAKTVRDGVMLDLDAAHPGYGWESNMGYGTQSHKTGLDQFGVTKHHRKSFKPIRQYLGSFDK
ncbi:ribonuclease HII [Candidatus Puniceispirillum sp.]|nr:ribonuclease HII [Candidatus Puniceispirillum sp.]